MYTPEWTYFRGMQLGTSPSDGYNGNLKVRKVRLSASGGFTQCI